MLGSPFIFNPILWLIIILGAFLGSFIPKDQTCFIPWTTNSSNGHWEYDNVDDDIADLKSHYRLGKEDIYVFKATHVDIPQNQWQDVVFTDEDGNIYKQYLKYDLKENKVIDTVGWGDLYEYPYICKTDYPDKSGYWEPELNHLFVYLPIEKRTGPEVEFRILDNKGYTLNPYTTFFTYYVDINGVSEAVDRVNISYRYDNGSLIVLSETHGFE